MSPRIKKLLELDEEIKRLESQIQFERVKELKSEGIKYHQLRGEK